MQRIPCEVDHCLHHLQNNYCELDYIHITSNGFDTNCGNYERNLPEGETTTVFSYIEHDDTLERGPFD